MKTYTEQQLMDAIQETWNMPDYDITSAILHIIKGELIDEHIHEYPDNGIYFMVIQNPEYHITASQLCSIMDEGNHCLSKGSIFYENEVCYITWSNYGHI